MKSVSSKELLVRRAARELRDGFFVNLGIGIPTLVSNYIPEIPVLQFTRRAADE